MLIPPARDIPMQGWNLRFKSTPQKLKRFIRIANQFELWEFPFCIPCGESFSEL